MSSFHLHDIQRKTGNFIRKFGSANDVDKAEVPIDIWSYSDELSTYVFPSDNGETMYISSSNTLDTTPVTIEGLDENFEEKSQTVTLTGQTRITLDGLWSRVFRAFNSDSSELAGDVYIYTNGANTNGVPNTDSHVKAVIDVGFNQTTMAIYTVPANKSLHIMKYHISIDPESNGDTHGTMSIDVREFGKIFRSQEVIAVSSSSPSIVTMQMPLYYPAKSDIKMVMKSISRNNVDVHAVFEGMLL